MGMQIMEKLERRSRRGEKRPKLIDWIRGRNENNPVFVEVWWLGD
jgi:hypothetical protein